MTGQAIRAGASGLCATGVDVGVLVLLHRHGMPVAPAAFVSATAGALTSFALNKYVAFRERSAITALQVARFAVVALTTALMMAIAMQVVAVGLHVPYVLAKLLCAATTFAVWTYPAQRRHVFAVARS